MELETKLHTIKKPIMVLGTSSGAGKSLTVTAICRILKNLGQDPIPYKGQKFIWKYSKNSIARRI